MKRQVLSIVSSLVFAAMFTACKSAPEPERAPAPTERTEERTQRPTSIHDQVHAALDRAEGLDASRIRVVVADNGVVHLSGTVASQEEKRRAHNIAHNVPGVHNVYVGQLEVDTSQATR